MDDDAAFISIKRHLDSQEEKLQSCHFKRESEVFSGDMQSSSSEDEASEQATGILMLTMPESSDDYQTPPENQLDSQNSDGQVPATKTAPFDQEIESGGVGDGETMVVEDSYDRKEKRMVDITKDSDNLEFTEKSPANLENSETVLEGNNTVMILENTVEEINGENIVAGANKMMKEGAHELFVEMSKREENTSLNKIDDHDDSNQVDLKGKRRLPFTVNETEKKHVVFLDLINRSLKLLKGVEKVGAGDDGDCDFLETAKRRGMTFPRPRWWPPEGGCED